MNYIAIVAAVLSMLCAGCVQHRLLENTRVPEIELLDSGEVCFRGKIIKPDKVADELEDAGIPEEQEINILVNRQSNRRLMTYVMIQLGRAGYKRAIFVTPRSTSSDVKTYTGAPIAEPGAVKF